MNITKLVILGVVLSFKLYAGQGTGNGGDPKIREFIFLGNELSLHLGYLKKVQFKSDQKEKFKKVVKETTIKLKKSLSLGGSDVTAINFPVSKEIHLSSAKLMKYPETF